ncbi:hypothetical protein K491DRAFT_719212 [Lophiostoma macrostomum CBS 122681]|uniref:Uncharacterized protein n=1 Tax=Lophiostoma macrostomum CBS 122681 TaxID=1314788 RepID=A0A6A6SWM9_9PLEO|nr:hypothetical protein K491DRAFT_719212 [Lophiostoma macrostomum CBS 122681]
MSATNLINLDYFRQRVRDDCLDLTHITPEQITEAAKARQMRELRHRYSELPYDPYEPAEKAKWQEAVFAKVRHDIEKEHDGKPELLKQVSFQSLKARLKPKLSFRRQRKVEKEGDTFEQEVPKVIKKDFSITISEEDAKAVGREELCKPLIVTTVIAGNDVDTNEAVA